MARIPFAAIQGGTAQVDAPPLQAATVQADPSAGLGAMAAARGLAMGVEVADKFIQARNSVKVSDAVLDSSDKLDAYRQDLEKDGDHATREQRFQRRLNEERDEKLQGLTDPRARDDYRMRFNRVARSMQAQVRNQARDEETQIFRMKLGENLDTLANKVVVTKNVQERDGYQLEAQAAIEDAVRTGRISAHGARTMQRAYLGKVDGALAAEMIRTDPGGAIAALGDPEKFKYLDASQRVNLRAQAQQRSESLSAQARVELRGDAQDLTTAMAQGQPVDPGQVQALIKRAGPKSTIGASVQRSWDFYQRVQVETTDKNIPQLAAAIARIDRGEPTTHDGYTAPRTPDGKTMTELSITVTDPRLNGGQPTNIPSLWGGRQVSESEAVKRALASGRAWQGFESIEAAEVAANVRSEALGLQLAQGAKPPTAEDLHLSRVLKTALGRKIEERDRDPAAYALKNYPTIAEDLVRADQLQNGQDETAAQDAPALRRRAWQTMEATQLAEGVPAHKVALLTKPQADALQAQLLQAEGQARVDLVQQLKHTYGDSWARAWNQISDGKPMPGDVQVIASMPQGANMQAVIVAEAFKLQDKAAGEVLGTQKIGEVDKAVRAQVGPMAGTMAQAPGGPEFLATYQNAAEKVARLLVIRGEGVEAAAKRAADIVFYDHWEVVDQARVPKVNGQPIVPASAVRATQRQVIDALPKMDLIAPAAQGVTPAQARDALARHVKSSGYWMTTADDKGLVLMAGNGMPVLTKDGPVMLGFDSVLAGAGNQAAQENAVMRAAAGFDQGSDPAPPAAGGPAWLQELFVKDGEMREQRTRARLQRQRDAQ